MMRPILVGAACFMLGAIAAALSATTSMRPDQFIAAAWTWTGIQSFTDATLVLLGSSSGSSTVKAPATGGGTATLPAGSGTIAYVGGSGVGTVTNVTCNSGLSGGAITTTGTCALDMSNANTWAALQTYTNSDIALLGSSTGKTTLTSANAGASNYTLTLPAASTTIPIATQTLTYSGPSTGRTITYPDAAFTVAALNVADQTVAGGANVTSLSLGTVSSGTTTIDCGSRPQQYLTNGGAFTLAAPASDGSCLVDSVNNGSAGTITFSGFTVGTATGDTLDTTNAHGFTIFVWRTNSVAGYRIAAHQ